MGHRPKSDLLLTSHFQYMLNPQCPSSLPLTPLEAQGIRVQMDGSNLFTTFSAWLSQDAKLLSNFLIYSILWLMATFLVPHSTPIF